MTFGKEVVSLRSLKIQTMRLLPKQKLLNERHDELMRGVGEVASCVEQAWVNFNCRLEELDALEKEHRVGTYEDEQAS